MEELVLEKGIPSLVVPTTSTIIQNKMATWDDFLYISKHGDRSLTFGMSLNCL